MATHTNIGSQKVNSASDIQKITPFLWFDTQAEEAADFYTSIFKNSKIKFVTKYSEAAAKASGMQKGSVMTVVFQIEGREFVAINGGPVFKISPVISFFVNCKSAEEIDELWKKLSQGGTTMMELGKYPFNEKYGWIEDKYGVSWQLILQERPQKITSCLMFTGSNHKKAEEAINFYISIFRNSGILQLERYTAGQGPEGAIVHSRFQLNGEEFIAMDSHMPLAYEFSEAISLVVNCEDQSEIDHFWEKLSDGGDERAQQCGWLKDKYGVSWQIVPFELEEMLQNAGPEKAEKLMQNVIKMKKLDQMTLKKIYSNS